VVSYFGFFGFVAKPLFLWLEWTHDYWAPNWGWAIVILTVIINIPLFPLRYSGMKSQLMQQKIQPEIESIRSRYKGIKLTDPRQRDMQQEIQELQKREGINPLGGCLPTLIQMPFLFAFYRMIG
jgi:YidC/Oxa1 family membrane protein insertase